MQWRTTSDRLKGKKMFGKKMKTGSGGDRDADLFPRRTHFSPHIFLPSTGLPVQAIDSAATNQNWIECPPAIAA
jgi:hypothetical protein